MGIVISSLEFLLSLLTGLLSCHTVATKFQFGSWKEPMLSLYHLRRFLDLNRKTPLIGSYSPTCIDLCLQQLPWQWDRCEVVHSICGGCDQLCFDTAL